ncbi:MAG TPA: helix-turn-helix domain-containing protein [Candidatus Merdenecus merdavium]|nr:helix-turn-helix domain-containing protein [Candidatus Merdenecus merdavium]
MKKNLQTAFSRRQYMYSEDFEIYYYHDLARLQMESHKHDYYEFYFFLEGDVVIRIEEQEYPLTPGDMVLIPPHIKHHVVIRSQEQPYRRFVFWVSEKYCHRLTDASPDYVYLMQYVQLNKEYVFHNDVISFNTIQSKIFGLIEELNSNRFGKEARLSLCVNDLVLHLNRVVHEQKHPKTSREELRLYQNLMNFIEEHLEEDLSLDRLSKEFYVSKYYIAHMFKDNIGISTHQYITKKRLAAVKDAIAGNVSISEAYLLYGFQDYSSFYRAFKKEFGMSPREFKESNSYIYSK